MKKVLSALMLFAVLMLLSAGMVMAHDYVAPPGVLSPDEVDFGGKTVTIIRRGLPDEERVAEAEKLFNVKIESLRMDTPEAIMARIMAGDSNYDIIGQAHREGYFKLVAAGMLLPADNYLPEEFYDFLPNADYQIITKLQYGGHLYGMAPHAGIVNDSMMIRGRLVNIEVLHQ